MPDPRNGVFVGRVKQLGSQVWRQVYESHDLALVMRSVAWLMVQDASLKRAEVRGGCVLFRIERSMRNGTAQVD